MMHKTLGNRMRRKRGYTLLEVILYSALLLGVANVCMVMLGSASRISALTRLALDRAEGATETRQLFAETVRRAVAVAPGVPGMPAYTTSETMLVVQWPDEAGAPRYVALGVMDPSGVLSQVTFTGAAITRSRHTLLPLNPVRFEMVPPAGPASGAPLVRMRYSARLEEGEATRKPPVPHEAQAALRGWTAGSAGV